VTHEPYKLTHSNQEIGAEIKPCDSVYQIVETMPSFGKSGKEDLMTYLAKNLRIIDECPPGEVRTLTWIVDQNGEMINIDVLAVNDLCRSTIVQQLRKMPRWTPGKVNGRPVCVEMKFRMCIKQG
jgi:hypothetical protein